MSVGVVRKTADGERRVALVPKVVASLVGNRGVDVVVESGARIDALIPDSQYVDAGGGPPSVTRTADIVLRVAPPSDDRSPNCVRARS